MFQQKLLARSGVADTSCFPEGLTDGLRHGKKPNLEAAKAESELVLYTIVKDLLRKTGIAPSEVSPFTALGQRATHRCPCGLSSKCHAARLGFQLDVQARPCSSLTRAGCPRSSCCWTHCQGRCALGAQEGCLQAESAEAMALALTCGLLCCYIDRHVYGCHSGQQLAQQDVSKSLRHHSASADLQYQDVLLEPATGVHPLLQPWRPITLPYPEASFCNACMCTQQTWPYTQVDIVIVSCSCFGPTPSLAAMVVNRFDMRESTLTYNLGGMGCCSSVIAVDLAKHLLMVRAWIRCSA